MKKCIKIVGYSFAIAGIITLINTLFWLNFFDKVYIYEHNVYVIWAEIVGLSIALITICIALIKTIGTHTPPLPVEK